MLGFLLLAAACDAQVDADYGGEPLVFLNGVIVAFGDVTVPRLVLRWSTSDPLGPGEAETPLVLRTSFPNRFEAGVLGEPPKAARLSMGDGEPDFSEAYVFAIAADGGTLGADFGHALVWLDADAPEGSAAAVYLGAPLAAGFHVMSRVETPVPPPEQTPLIERCLARASAEGWTDAAATSACRFGHSYRLSPAPGGLDEAWTVRAVTGGP